MTKEEHIKWWIDESDRNWETAIHNLAAKQFVFALFAFHLSLEKLLKAIWVKDNADNYPPRTHDLTKLHNESDLELENGWYDYLGTINDWNIESRYPDYKLKLYKRADMEYLLNHQIKLNKLRHILKQIVS